MSTYDDSSLFLYPSGYKASVLFAQKPMDANGQLAFTRSNDTATRVASNGLIEKVRTNLNLYSEQMDNAYYTKTTGTTVTANNAANPIDGALTADTINYDGTGTSGGLRIYSSPVIPSINGYEYTWSVWLRCATPTTFILNNNRASTAVNVTSTWQRFSVTGIGNGSSSIQTLIYSNTGNNSPFALEVFGQQVEVGVMTDYIPTVAAAVSVGPVANIPRIDYLGGGCGKLLLEPQATALNQFSESFDNAYWIKNDVTISANTTETLDPAGYYGADKVVETATAARHRVAAGSTTISAVNHTASVFMKKGTARYGFVTFSGAAVSTIVVDLENGTITSTSTSGTIVAQKVEDYGSGWYRISVTALGTATTTTYTLQFGSAGSATPSYTSNIPSFTGSTSNYLYAWGANLTATSYLQSYIPTLAASVTRGADLASASYTGLTTTSGSLFIDLKEGFAGQNINSGVASLGLRLSSTGTNDSVGLRDATLGTFQGVMRVGGTSSNLGAVISGTAATKVCFVWTASTVKMFKDGALFGSASISTPAVFNTIELPNSTRTVSAPLSQFLIFPTALSDAEAIAITTL